MNQQQNIAATLVFVGIIFGIGGVILDLNGAGAWIHGITWVGGGAFGYGIVMWVRTGRDKGPFPPARG